MVELPAENQIAHVQIIENTNHEAGGCMQPIALFQTAGVNAIGVAGMGLIPCKVLRGWELLYIMLIIPNCPVLTGWPIDWKKILWGKCMKAKYEGGPASAIIYLV